ncbi:MAG TPA: ATP-binding protein [Sphingobium sp.]
MRIRPNLSVRAVAILLGGFVALQLLIVLVTRLPSHGSDVRPYGLPEPREISVMIASIERAPVSERARLAALFDEGLYTARISPDGVTPSPHETTDDLVNLGRYYAKALPGHAVAVDARRAWLGALTSDTRPARLFAPVSLSISLDDGSALVLTSRPSDNIQAFLGRRSLLGAVAGLLLLVILMVAMRQTMKPVTHLARAVRAYRGDGDHPALPVEGASEVRDLARAFNEMRGRISGLIGERTHTLAAIAHDMRTYLTRLRLRAEYIDDADHRERAVRDLDEMAALLDDTLLLARGDVAKAAEPAEPVDIAALVRDAIEVREADPAKLILDVPEEPVTVRARPLAVRRIVANLVDNGERYAAHVKVALMSRSGQALLVVCDDGPGIAPGMLARLGEPFVRADPSRNRESGGAGLGLAIVRALAARDGGTVQFENRACGGLRVTLAWPLA